MMEQLYTLFIMQYLLTGPIIVTARFSRWFREQVFVSHSRQDILKLKQW